MAEPNVTQSDPLPVMTDAKLKSALGRISDKYTKGFYSKDTSWAPIQGIMKDVKEIIPFGLVDTSYDTASPPKYKTWVCIGAFVTPDGKQRVVPAQIRANGAGSIEDPLDRFDVTFTYLPMSPSNVSDSKQKEYLKTYGVKTRDASAISVVGKYAASISREAFKPDSFQVKHQGNSYAVEGLGDYNSMDDVRQALQGVAKKKGRMVKMIDPDSGDSSFVYPYGVVKDVK